jgi:exopolyphosphatase/guanosine-5'-triphosphate,3'-diphosphate pyrophosphatase
MLDATAAEVAASERAVVCYARGMTTAATTRSSAPTMLAVVDMGSNSFRLEVGRVEGDQIYPQDTWRETLRIGAGLDSRGRLTAAAQRAAVACLSRFAERLRGLHPTAVRVVATNTFRVARNAAAFLCAAERAVGFPIDVIGGHEEARLIYLGAAHVLPPSATPRLLMDIGGGSTEFIIGLGFEPSQLDSLNIGCVGMTQRFFADGRLAANAFKAAETHARAEIEAIASTFHRSRWQDAYASSGTALALADILESNGFSTDGITPGGMARLRRRMVAAGHIERLELEGLKPARAPVLAGGFAVMQAAIAELDIDRVRPVGGALRLGVLYDLLGRDAQRDSRNATVERLIERYGIDREHARRVSATAKALYERATARPVPQNAQRVEWAGLLHEVGFGISHTGFHKHGAYILGNADMPGFSSREQEHLALLVLACRGRLDKVAHALGDVDLRAQVLALRVAVLLHHARRSIDVPPVALSVGRAARLRLPDRWLRSHPLTAHLVAKERSEWRAAGYRL